MSPAMVDFTSPLQNPISRKGQDSSSVLFDLAASFNNLSKQSRHPTMNSNDANSRSFDDNGSLPSFDTSSVSPAFAPSAAPSGAGLSRPPRLFKLRRHSQRGKATSSASLTPNKDARFDSGFNPFRLNVPILSGRDGNDAGMSKNQVQESRGDSGFNLFRPSVSVSDGSERGSGSKETSNESQVGVSFNSFNRDQISSDKMGKESETELDFNPFCPSTLVIDGSNQRDRGEMPVLQDQKNSWNPFSSQEVRGRDGFNGPNLERFEFGKSGDSRFVFGASPAVGAQSLSDSKSDSKNTLSDQVRNLKIGSETESQSLNNVGSNLDANSDFVFGASRTVGSQPVFDSKSDSKGTLSDQVRKLKIGSEPESQSTNNVGSNLEANSGFEFGPSRPAGAQSVLNSKPDSKDALPNEMRKLDDSGFVFGASGTVGVQSVSGSKSDSKDTLSDQVRNLKIGSETESQSSNNVGSNLDANSGFVFGASRTVDSQSVFDTKSDSKDSLSDQVRKLKIGSEAESQSTNNMGSNLEANSGFEFGPSRPPGAQSVLNSKPDLKDALPDEMRELKIGSGMGSQNANSLGSNLPGDGNASSDSNSKEASQKGVFVFGSSVKKSSNFGPRLVGNSLEAELLDQMRKLKVGSGIPSQDTNSAGFIFNVGGSRSSSLTSDSSEVPEAGAFVFGSSRTRSSDMGPSVADEISVSELPDEIRKLKIEASGCKQVSQNADTDFSSKVVENPGFVFKTSSKNVAGSFGGIAENELPVEMEKPNIDNGTSFAKDRQSQNPASGIFSDFAAASSIPSPFTFKSGLQDKHSGSVPSTQLKGDLGSSKVVGPSSSSTSIGSGFQSGSDTSENPPAGLPVNYPDFSFEGIHEGFGTPHMDFRTPKQDASWSYRDSLFGRSDQNVEFSAKRGTGKEMKPKKRKGKLVRKNLTSMEKSSKENSELGSPGSCSPMDLSPYQETLAADQFSRETSAVSGDSIPLEPSNIHEAAAMDTKDGDLLAATECLNMDKVNLDYEELHKEFSEHHFEGDVRTEHLASQYEKGAIKSDSENAAFGAEASVFGSSVERQASDSGMMFQFATSSEDGETNFTFSATPSARGPLSATKRHHRKKNWMKVTQDSYSSTPNTKIQSTSNSLQFLPLANSSFQQDLNHGHSFGSSSLQLEPGQSKKGETRVSQNEADKERGAWHDPMPTISASAAAQEACEKWRHRGNQAYANGNLSKAEDYYTRGVTCVSPKETSRSCVRALMLCYSNRAATRMSLGRMREALGDCMMAAAIEPNFLRAQVRAANCYLALGEIEDALKHFKKCLQTGCDVSIDQKIRAEAFDGFEKAQQVAGYMDRSAELLKKRSSDNSAKALELITEALLISPYSENLIEMRAEALLMLRKYEEVVQLCEQTLESAERNSSLTSADNEPINIESSESMKSTPVHLRRWRLISRSYFYLGRLEEALELLQKHEQVGPIKEKYGSGVLESSAELTATMRDLLRHKAAGNEAFQAGRHAEAIEHYSAALQCNVESHPFTAICFANRAAAYQALGQITDAIADCSLAIALDSNYPKAISRRATLHEMIRDYGQAASDLERLISLLDKQTDDKANQSGASGRSSLNDLKQARIRLATMEEAAKKGIPLDMYLILGIEPSSTAVDVKKAYRKAALRHHPDKAGQFLARSENGDDGLWKEVAEEAHKDADRLFKMIGEAYAVLSDTTKRLHYDAEEEMRNAQKKGNGSSTSKTSGDVHSYPFDKSSNRQQWRDPWKSRGSAQQWSWSSRSSRYP